MLIILIGLGLIKYPSVRVVMIESGRLAVCRSFLLQCALKSQQKAKKGLFGL